MKRIIIGALLLLLPTAASASEALSVDQLFAEYEAEVAVTLPSHWECVCVCQYEDELGTIDLENPETGDEFFYPGGSKEECSAMNGNSCIGTVWNGTRNVKERGTLQGCEWTLVPDAK